MKKKILLIITICFITFLTSCNLFHKHNYIDYRCECGKTQNVPVTFIDNNGTNEIKIKYGTQIDINEYDFLQNTDELFIGWYIGNQKFDFHNSIIQPLTLVARYKEYHTVTFKDFDGTIIDTQQVYSCDSAIPPKDPERLFYDFIGWDKNFSYVLEDLEVVAKYKPSKMEFNINYVIDERYMYYQSKEEMVLDFLYDFYDFVNPEESIKTFIYGIENGEPSWINYIGGSEGIYNYLIYNNNIDENNEEYFFNSSKYKDKWYVLSSYVKNYICAGNKRFGYPDVTYSYGALDFKRYITNNPGQYVSSYGGQDVFYGFPKKEIIYDTTYKYTSDDIELYKSDNLLFDGWYLDEEYLDGPYTKIETGSIGHKTFYAKIKDKLTYTISFDSKCDINVDNIYVSKDDFVTLPMLNREGYTFIGWYIDYEKCDNEFTYDIDCSIHLEARWKENGKVNTDYLTYDGKTITYKNSYVAVEIPDAYVEKDEELRACWVSSFISGFEPSTNKEEMMKELTDVLDFLESYNMNCMIFHIRTHNNAFYKTNLAPIDSKYGTYESFEEWDYLQWLIDECHKRNIEFHAWFNPYRIKLYGISNDLSFKEATELVTSEYANYPDNPASDKWNILLTYGAYETRGAILNPAVDEVQNYIVNVCMEVVKNYDIDAIHFDDYFYQKLSESDSILDDPDQDNYDFYINNNETSFKLDSVSDKEDWRRMNVDNLIEKIYLALTKYEAETGRHIDFGISPTGVYKSGDGSIESGSNTSNNGHFNGNLYCDTVKWINEGWIDYIMPQCYTSFDYESNSFQDMTSWWNKVVEGKDVNLYIGLGISNSIDSTYKYSWHTQEEELINQLLYLNTLNNVKGVSLFSFTSMKKIYNDNSYISYNAFIKLRNELWQNKVHIPKNEK